jgi:hypothetical protein
LGVLRYKGGNFTEAAQHPERDLEMAPDARDRKYIEKYLPTAPAESRLPEDEESRNCDHAALGTGRTHARRLKGGNDRLAASSVPRDEPASVSGREGFRFVVALKSDRGREMQRQVVGCTDETPTRRRRGHQKNQAASTPAYGESCPLWKW